MKAPKLECRISDLCYYCGQPFIDNNGKQIKPIAMSEKGLVHRDCQLYYKDQKDLKICFIINCWSIGDTITTTPVLREVKRLYPKSHIDVITTFPELFRYNPHVNSVIERPSKMTNEIFNSYDVVLDAFNTQTPDYPHHWNTHCVQFSAHCTLRKTLAWEDCSYQVDYGENDLKNAEAKLTGAGIPLNKPLIILHPYGAEWKTRTWTTEAWRDVAKHIINVYGDFKVITIGGSREKVKKMDNFIDMSGIKGLTEFYGKFEILETIALMDRPQSRLLVTMDTAPLHMAACCNNICILGLFTVVNSRYRTPIRNKKLGHKFWAIDSRECSCTYNFANLIENINLLECKKQLTYGKMLNNNISNKEITTAWNNIHGTELQSVTPEMIMQKINEYKDLKCMPNVIEVKNKIDQIIYSFYRE